MGIDLHIYAEVFRGGVWIPVKDPNPGHSPRPELAQLRCFYFVKNYAFAEILGVYPDCKSLAEHRDYPEDASPELKLAIKHEDVGNGQWVLASEFADFDWDATAPSGFECSWMAPGGSFRYYAEQGQNHDTPEDETINGLISRFKELGPLDQTRLICMMVC